VPIYLFRAVCRKCNVIFPILQIRLPEDDITQTTTTNPSTDMRRSFGALARMAKASTGIAGLPVVPNSREVLQKLVSKMLNDIQVSNSTRYECIEATVDDIVAL